VLVLNSNINIIGCREGKKMKREYMQSESLVQMVLSLFEQASMDTYLTSCLFYQRSFKLYLTGCATDEWIMNSFL